MLVDIYGVTEKDSVPVVSSRKVAEVFGKRHDNVLQDIRGLMCSDKFRLLNFQESSYRNEQNKKQPEFTMTKDGFAFLAMGFTGEKAAAFKEAYINRFNEMEAFIRNLYEAKAEFPEFTQAIMMTHDEPRHYHFSNEVDMINRIVLGVSSKQFREDRSLGKVSSIRPYLTGAQIESIKALQRVDIGLIVAIPDFQQRKQALINYHHRLISRKSLVS